MAKARRSWFGAVHQKFFRSPTRPRETIIVLHINDTCSSLNFAYEPRPPPSPTTVTGEYVLTSRHMDTRELSSTTHSQKHDNLSVEEAAAAKIQAYFRRRLARRAYRALKSLVKLQAVVREVCVRRQARLALECMHALVRLQVTVRARQLLLTPHQLQPI